MLITTLHVHRSTSLHLGSRRLALLPGSNIPGDYRCLAIPVPIPNTVVKQLPPMIVRMRESRLSPGSLSALCPLGWGALLFVHVSGRRSRRSAHGRDPGWMDWWLPLPPRVGLRRLGRFLSGLGRGQGLLVGSSPDLARSREDSGPSCGYILAPLADGPHGY